MNSDWQLKISPTAKKQLRQLDKPVQKRILAFLHIRLRAQLSPIDLAVPLAGNWKGFYKFRVGDYRIICDLQHNELVIAVVKVGHRREIYD